MLFNPKWNKPAAKVQPMLLSFIAWLEQQPADKTYNYGHIGGCAIAQWRLAHGLPAYVLNIDATYGPGWNDIVWAIPPHSTFGHALKRARALAEKQMAS